MGVCPDAFDGGELDCAARHADSAWGSVYQASRSGACGHALHTAVAGRLAGWLSCGGARRAHQDGTEACHGTLKLPRGARQQAEQIRDEIESIYAFCERNDLVGTLKKANSSTTAKDIYLQAYQRDLAKVQDAILKTEECLTAYERTVATLEVSSVGTDIGSDYDIAIEMLDDLREELPRYNLEDRV